MTSDQLFELETQAETAAVELERLLGTIQPPSPLATDPEMEATRSALTLAIRSVRRLPLLTAIANEQDGIIRDMAAGKEGAFGRAASWIRKADRMNAKTKAAKFNESLPNGKA